MRPHRLRPRPHWAFLVLLSALFVVGIGVVAAGAFEDIQVTQPIPPDVEQAQTINVTVKGKGFESSAKAKFLVSGTRKTGGVTVNSTTFVDAETLQTNVTAAANATVSLYDIEVQLSNGRRGKGIELFSVKVGKNTSSLSLCVLFRDSTTIPDPDRILSDGKGDYCDRQDGQVTLGLPDNGKFHLNMNKFDRNNRTAKLEFTSCADSSCTFDGSLPASGLTDVVFQSGLEYVDQGGQLVAGNELNFRTLALKDPPDVRFVSLRVRYVGQDGFKRAVGFTNETEPAVIFGCPGAEPAEVVCTGVDVGGTCIRWTVKGRQACLKRAIDKAGSTFVVDGLYNLDFKVTLLAIP